MHPFELYHHFIFHKNMGEECVACPHVHKELQLGIAGLSVAIIYLLWKRK